MNKINNVVKKVITNPFVRQFVAKQHDITFQLPKEEIAPELVNKKAISLQFSKGCEFSVSLENKKLVISATVNGQEAFYLDDIPEDFINALKKLLGDA